MAWEPKPEVVEVMALWLFHKEHPDVLDWEADEKAADEKLAAARAAKAGANDGLPSPAGAARTEYEERARAMLMVARRNSGSGG